MAEDGDPVFKPPQPLAPAKTTEQPPPELPPPLTESNPPDGVYFLEIMKNGSIICRIDITKNRISFGRSREADVPLDHPSISRYHAVILWKESEQSDRGYFYLMDLNSTHGSSLNKNKVTPGAAIKIPIGNNVIKFGGSTRSFMVNSVITEVDDVSEVNVSDNVADQSKDTGCSWGMREDASADDDEEENEEAFMEKFTTLLNTPQCEPSPNENAFSDNPQKTLQIWFDQEGYDFEYQVVPEGSNFKATLQLPIEGRDVPIEGSSQSKKKEAITQLCLKVCKLLDRAERLFPWQHQNNRKRNRNKIEEDEEEDLYDETEQSKAKKAKKLLEQKLNERKSDVETYESLKVKYENWSKELMEIEAQLTAISQSATKTKPEETSDEAIDPLDQFMESQLVDDGARMEVKIEKSRLRMKIKDLEKKISNCEKLMIIAKPTHIPLFKSRPDKSSIVQLKVAESSSAQNISNTQTSENKTKDLDLEQEVSNVTSTKPSKFQMKIMPKNVSSSKIFAGDGELIKKETKNAPHVNVGLGVGASLKEMKQKVVSGTSESHEDFIDWVPPKNQDGSGKTSLNDRYGY